MIGLLIQEFKTLVKSPASISILIIPLVLLVGLGYLLPSGWIVPSSITIGIVAAVLLYFGGSIEEIKRTSFMKSVSLTRLSKFTFLATKILFAMIVSMISVLWVLLFSWVFTATPLAFLATDFSNLLGGVQEGAMAVVAQIPFDIHWDMVQWFKMLYAGIITIVVAVSLSFVFVAFAKSSLSFYLMSFGYLLAMILFGGVVMPGFLISGDNQWFKDLYYIVPNYYTNNIMANAFSGGVLNSVITPLTNRIDGLFDFAAYTGIIDAPADLIGIMNIFLSGGSKVTDVLVNGTSNADALAEINAWAGWDGTEAQLIEIINWVSNVINSGDTIEFVTRTETFSTSAISIEQLNAYSDDVFVLFALHGNEDYFADMITNQYGLGSYLKPTLSVIFDKLGLGAALLNSAVVALNALAGNVLVLGESLAPLSDNIHEATATIREMFGNIDWWNWPIPWIEGVLFLGISITFFKWS